MRDLNECQAEVFRRSEKRIKERKQHRNHMLTACIPLVLCVTLFLSFWLSGVLPEGIKNASTTETEEVSQTHNSSESLSCPIAKITVSGVNFSKTYTKASDVLPISNHLYAYGTRGPENNGITSEGDVGEGYETDADDVSGSIADSVNSGYTITLILHEGQKTEYYLLGKTLNNLNTNQTYTLTQKQVKELKDLLGIPHL